MKLFAEFDNLADFEKTENEKENFEKSKNISEQYLREFMKNLSKNEKEFMQFAYMIRVHDDLANRPNYYTSRFLSYIEEPFFESVILSNKWDKLKKTMIVDP